MMERYAELDARKGEMKRLSEHRDDVPRELDEEEVEEVEERREMDGIETSERDLVGRSEKAKRD